MSTRRIGRREFVRDGSALVAAAAAGTGAMAAETDKPDPKKIVNYNPKMHYRRLGKTELMLSEVSLGGHWTKPGGGIWGGFPGGIIPDAEAKNRTDVISACIDSGVNFVDSTTPAEQIGYGVAMKGRREKMILGLNTRVINWKPRGPRFKTVKAVLADLDKALERAQTDYAEVWRLMCIFGGFGAAETGMLVEAFEIAKKAGKVQHLGFSTHNQQWARYVMRTYPEVGMVIFPITAKTKVKSKPPTPENVTLSYPYADANYLQKRKDAGENDEGDDKDLNIFEVARKYDVGVVGMKPFSGGGALRGAKGKDGGKKATDDLARLTLRAILSNPAITAAIPGLADAGEVKNAAQASCDRKLGMTPRQKQWLARITDERWEQLTPEYRWLHDWEVV